ncbi:MAG: class I SAM-dependent methyltransferase [Candidatus Woesearchaeota archaeon]
MDFDGWAEVYDIIYTGHKNDVPFYLKEAEKAGGNVLELACGTGRIYLEMLKRGINAYGIDISAGMLAALRKKARSMGLKPAVKKADMRTFRFRHRFSLIIIPFSSFLHNLETGEQIKALKNIRKHLKPGGRLVLDFFLPSPDIMANHYGRDNKRTVKKGGSSYTLVSRSVFADEPNQIVKTRQVLKKNNRTIWRDSFTIALIYKREFELLLKAAGFTRYRVYGGFNHKPLRPRSSEQQMVWEVRK